MIYSLPKKQDHFASFTQNLQEKLKKKIRKYETSKGKGRKFRDKEIDELIQSILINLLTHTLHWKYIPYSQRRISYFFT